MAKLLIRSGGEQTGEIRLKPGTNRIGRSATCDFQIVDASISSNHCEVMLTEDSVRVRDLSSTNGTFIEGKKVDEAVLQPGQTLRLGSIELFFPPQDAVESKAIASPTVTPTAAEPPCAPSTKSRLHVVLPEAPPPLPPRIGPSPTARQYMAAMPPNEKTFFQRLPSAFSYPFKRNGVTLLLTGTIFFAVLTFLLRAPKVGFYGLLGVLVIGLFTLGYLAAYLQKIIVSSAGGEDDLPPWPDFTNWWDDIIQPAFLVVATFFVSFSPVLGLVFWGGDLDASVRLVFIVALLLFGSCYLPMALLAVAMYDTVFALNPLLIVPSMIKIPKEYLATCGILAVTLLLETGCSFVLNLLPIWIVPTLISGFLSLYFFAVEMRILGLMYHSKQDELNWSF
jgi:hypothetical protein